jgi:hypothetical protein
MAKFGKFKHLKSAVNLLLYQRTLIRCLYSDRATDVMTQMRFRKLRIAWSLAWGVIALLFVILEAQHNAQPG